MKIIETSLPGVLLLKPKVFGDYRGYFQETFHSQRYRDAGLNVNFVQDNHSRSRRGVCRGLHYQITHPQGKLVMVMRGEVFDVVVDIRRGSDTFGESFCMLLNDKDNYQIYVPPGFAHGFCVVSDEVDFVYKCTDYYHLESERGIAWNDPAININWPINESEMLLSEKDRKNPLLQNIPDTDLPSLT